MMKWFNLLSILMLFILGSCVESTGSSSSKRSGVSQGGGESAGGNNTATPGRGVGSDNGGIGETEGALAEGRSEIRFLVDPFSGTYQNKVTIPKNFTGELYLSGLNINSLKSKLVSVRFNFGRERAPVIIPATITRGEGITPQTDIEVLAMSFSNQPFLDIRLLYQLFDYNDYRDNTGNEVEDTVQNARNRNLFCRGLLVEDDPTFEGSANNTRCDSAGETCLYSYARVLDAGLYNAGGVAVLPTNPQIDVETSDDPLVGYSGNSEGQNILKCLPDTDDVSVVKDTLGLAATDVVAFNTAIAAISSDYDTWKGPFRIVDENDWEITGDAIFSDVDTNTDPTGLFKSSINASDPETGLSSFLFPRAGKMDLTAGVEYFGSSTPFGARSLQTLVSSGDTEFMDGCNLRVNSFNPDNGENISSCNVSASIDIVTVDPITGAVDEVLASSKDVKLQLIRSSVENFRGEEVLYSALKRCESSNACGSGECCFNERCWSNEIVSQCVEDTSGFGNKTIGEACSTDYDCASFCCNQSTGTCQVHQNNEDEDEISLCGKSPGQQCVTNEFCRREFIDECFIVKTGSDSFGNTTCTLRCYKVPTFGDCINGTCKPPQEKARPIFDPENPDCSGAIDPPDIP